jgi:glycosyltransferase involved in cell wall biosynthesis
VKVAVIVTEIGRGVGGRFTFQEMLLRAIERVGGGTRHEFVPYSAGFSRHTEGSARWKARRLATVAGTMAVQSSYDVQDKVIGKRLVHVRTPLQRRLDRDGIDLVWFLTTYAEDVDLPFLCTVFDLEHRIKPWFPEVRAFGEFERRERFYHRYLPKATRVIVPNEAGVEQVGRFYRVPPENCLALAHPTPDVALEAAATPRRDAALVHTMGIDGRFLLYPAQFWPHKNHAAALDTLAELRRRGQEVALVCVGSDKGQREHVWQQVAERGLEDAVHLLGFVADDDLVALYQHADALLYVSRFGPENLPPLEAFALGCPVVAAWVPGAEAQLGEAALIVDPGDPGAVADAVQRATGPTEREGMVAAGRRRATSWTADDYVRGVIEFVDSFETERRLWS